MTVDPSRPRHGAATRPLGAVAALLLATAACSDAATADAGPTEARATDGAPAGASAPPAAPAAPADPYAGASRTSAEEALDDAFPAGPDGEAATASLTRAIDGDIRAQARCLAEGDRACATSLAAYRRARVAYATGGAVPAPAPFVLPPFPAGRFAPSQAGYAGHATLIPLADREALLVIDLAFRGKPVCSLAARTIADEDGVLDASPLDASLPALVLTRTADGGFDLAHADPATAPTISPFCAPGTGITGRYAPARQP